MGKPRLRNKRKEYKELSKRLAGYMMQVRMIYDRLNERAASIVESVGYDGAVEFSFADYPETKRDLQLLQGQFVDDMQSLIYSGTSAEWKRSNLLQDLVANKALKYYRAQVAGKKFKHYYQTNSDQLNAFQRRTERGLNLSGKLWNQSQIYKDSLEATISTAIEKGMSAVTLSKRISKYLNDWPSLQADYQEKFGKATNCYDCEYRSIRLARNEINIAYRTAEQLRWKQFDFILGYKIKLSGSHPRYDICDDLAGDYPKDFKFVGWHPNCYLPNALVLTDNGWKYIKEVSDSDKVLSLKPETRELEYVGIVARQSFQYQGEIVHFRNRSLDCAVTQDHRMVYLNKSDGRIKYKSASEFNKNNGGFYRGCEYQAEDIGSIDINGEVIQFDLFCEFMGYWLSDGSLMHNHQVVISQQKGEPAYDGILRCISGLGYKPYVCKDVIVFNDSKLNSYLKQFGTCNKKFIPKEIICSSTRQISIFLNAFVKCDGHTRKPKSFVGSHGNVFKGVNEEREFFTTSERLYAGLCELLLKIGKRPSVSVRAPSVTTKRDGSIIKGNYYLYIIRECNSVTAMFFTKTTERYEGMVYDLTLERNHIMYIQQNGKCYWGSNCLCYTVPIVMSEDEYWSDDRENSPNKIVNPPDNFNKWVYDNSQRMHKAESRGTLPYWIRDNYGLVEKSAQSYKEKFIASKPFVMTNELSKVLETRNIYINNASVYNQSAMSGFDIDHFDNFMELVGDRNKIYWKRKEIRVFQNGGGTLIYDGEYIDKNGNKQNPYLSRMFRIEDEKKVVYHDVFNLPVELQGKGISKFVFKELFKNYESMGIERVEVLANMDVGGYCWGRYGFSAKASEIKDLAQRRFSDGTIGQKDYDEIFEILNKSGQNIRMNKIANLECGKTFLLGDKVKWRGFIDLHDKQQMEYLHDYIGLTK